MPKFKRSNLKIAVEEDISTLPNDLAGGTPKHGLAGAPLLPGLTGLTNMGNTCYLNSSLQCLSHTLPMAQYFLNECWRGTIQDKQKRQLQQQKQTSGCGKEENARVDLCSAYTYMLKQLWMGDKAVVRPKGKYE